MRSSSGKFEISLIPLHDLEWLNHARFAGKVVSKCLNELTKLVKSKASLTTLQLSRFAELMILDHKCQPTFKGYHNFPEAVCISVNKELVHGIPKDYYLQDGDVVSFDLGATYNGAIADAATTCIFGEPKSKEHENLLLTTKTALSKGIGSISIGKQIGIIGETIYNYSKNNKYSVIQNYGGHGISIDKFGNGVPHGAPFISNKDINTNGVRVQAGMALAIEPMLHLGPTITTVAKDGWTVMTNDIGSHEEHTVYIHDNNEVEIITL